MNSLSFTPKLLSLFCIFYSVYSYNVTDEDLLLKDLLTNYNKELRAGNDRDYPVNVSVSFHLFAIKEFVEASSKFTVNGLFRTLWKDDRLSWNPLEYKNITRIIISQHKIWIPDLVIVNPYKDVVGLGNKLVNIFLESDGSCSWTPIQSFEVICDADVTNYPFDKQYCMLKFHAYSFGEEWMNITIRNSKVILSNYEESGLWKIEDTTCFSQTTNRFLEINIGLHLQRRSIYYIVGLILPMVLVSTLQSFVFLLPNTVGERVGFSVTVLLASVVFLTIIQEKLPESSEPHISILGILLLGFIAEGALVTLCVILSTNIHQFEETKPVPNWLNVLLCFKTEKVGDMNSAEDVLKVASGEDLKEEALESCSWNYIARLFDRFCFFCSLSIYATQIIIYFAIVL
ncbi:acetylcholine receptor subunit alpha-1-A-like [Saccostrea echinata]|uniref:acetylcholine receptor subunit alpha-1-A-like n=1 Tax=Saccostrea echinata TaxID=191078 RepID=UPI002A7FC470|nr:acetylcholine receptor subunit alpha-1-A-like [Saccostrea echinata]